MLVGMFCFASVPIFLKHFTGFLDAWTVNGIRYGVAALCWLPFVLRNYKSVPDGRNVWRDAIAPSAANTLGQIGWALTPYYNSAGVIGFVIRSSFLFTTAFGFALLPQERDLLRRPLFWIGVIGIIGGLVAMYGGSLRHGGTSSVGMLILLATAVCWGLYSVFVRRNMAGYDVRLSFGIISSYTSLTLWLAMFIFGDWMKLGGLIPENWLLLVLSALIGIALSHVFLYRAIHALGPVITQGGQSIQPFLTALGASIILGERLVPLQWFGGLLIAVACLCLVYAKCLRTE